jgi:hypothetical protein
MQKTGKNQTTLTFTGEFFFRCSKKRTHGWWTAKAWITRTKLGNDVRITFLIANHMFP